MNVQKGTKPVRDETGSDDEFASEVAPKHASSVRRIHLGLIALSCIATISIAAEVWLGGILLADEDKGVTKIGRLIFGFTILLGTTLLVLGYLTRMAQENWETAVAGKHRARYANLLSAIPIIKAIIAVIGSALIILFILDEIGVNLIPFLASAGIFGLMLSLGAQSMVKDVLAGIFYIAEDAIRVHDYVQVCGQIGTVERVLLRSARVRLLDGSVLTIPYSQIDSVINMSRDWAQTAVEFVVPHDTDPDEIFEIIENISQEFSGDDQYEDQFLDPIWCDGLENVDDLGLTFRIKFKTLPGEQFKIRRDVLRRLKTLLDSRGISQAKRTVVVKDHTVSSQAAAVANVEREPV